MDSTAGEGSSTAELQGGVYPQFRSRATIFFADGNVFLAERNVVATLPASSKRTDSDNRLQPTPQAETSSPSSVPLLPHYHVEYVHDISRSRSPLAHVARRRYPMTDMPRGVMPTL